MRLTSISATLLFLLVLPGTGIAQAPPNAVLFSGQECLIFDSSAPAGPDADDARWCGVVENSNLVFRQVKDPNVAPEFADSQALSGNSVTLRWLNNGNRQIFRPLSGSGFQPAIRAANFFTVVADVAARQAFVYYDSGPAGAGAICNEQGDPALALVFETMEPTVITDIVFRIRFVPNQAAAQYLFVDRMYMPYFPSFPDLYIPVEANAGDPRLTVTAGSFTAGGTFSTLPNCPDSFEIPDPPPGFGPTGAGRPAPLLTSSRLAALCVALLGLGVWVLRRRETFRNTLPLP